VFVTVRYAFVSITTNNCWQFYTRIARREVCWARHLDLINRFARLSDARRSTATTGGGIKCKRN